MLVMAYEGEVKEIELVSAEYFPKYAGSIRCIALGTGPTTFADRLIRASIEYPIPINTGKYTTGLSEINYVAAFDNDERSIERLRETETTIVEPLFKFGRLRKKLSPYRPFIYGSVLTRETGGRSGLGRSILAGPMEFNYMEPDITRGINEIVKRDADTSRAAHIEFRFHTYGSHEMIEPALHYKIRTAGLKRGTTIVYSVAPGDDDKIGKEIYKIKFPLNEFSDWHGATMVFHADNNLSYGSKRELSDDIAIHTLLGLVMSGMQRHDVRRKIFRTTTLNLEDIPSVFNRSRHYFMAGIKVPVGYRYKGRLRKKIVLDIESVIRSITSGLSILRFNPEEYKMAEVELIRDMPLSDYPSIYAVGVPSLWEVEKAIGDEREITKKAGLKTTDNVIWYALNPKENPSVYAARIFPISSPDFKKPVNFKTAQRCCGHAIKCDGKRFVTFHPNYLKRHLKAQIDPKYLVKNLFEMIADDLGLPSYQELFE